MKSFLPCSLRWSSTIFAIVLVCGVAWAQTGKSKAKPKVVSAAELKKLENKLEAIQNSFLRETGSLIKDYEDAGQYEKAKHLLEVMLKLDPKNDAIKKKIDSLSEQMLEQSEFDMDLDVSKTWQIVAAVKKDQLARIEADGEYKLTVTNATLGPDGYPSDDPADDLFAGAPTGCLMAVVFPPGGIPQRGAGGGNNQNNGGGQRGNRPGQPFPVKSKHEWTPKEDGVLMLRVNTPPGAKCVGKLKLKLSGVAKAPS